MKTTCIGCGADLAGWPVSSEKRIGAPSMIALPVKVCEICSPVVTRALEQIGEQLLDYYHYLYWRRL